MLIRDSKFHKSRLVTLSSDAAREIDQYLVVRQTRQLAVSPDSALLWHRTRRGTGVYRRGTQPCDPAPPARRTDSHRDRTRAAPHDFRHTFAVQALLRWYRAGADVNAKLPLLATYMGHVSIVSTKYYLQFVEPLATLASERFARQCGALVTAPMPAEVHDDPRSPNTLGRALRGFFVDHLPRVRGASPHTICSYRDTSFCCCDSWPHGNGAPCRS